MPSSIARSRARRGTLEHELERGARADQPRKPLRSAGARQKPELNLRQAELRARRRDAIIAGQRELESAAETVAVDRRDVESCSLVSIAAITSRIVIASPAAARSGSR